MTLLGAHKEANKMINGKIPLEKYIELRNQRDAKLKAPRFIHPSLQVSLYFCKKREILLFCE